MLKRIRRSFRNEEKKDRKEVESKKSKKKATTDDELNQTKSSSVDTSRLNGGDLIISELDNSTAMSDSAVNEVSINVSFQDEVEKNSIDVSVEKDVQEQKEFVMPETVTILETPEGSKVYLIGTAHFSRKSCEEVKELIRHVQPNVVVLEICECRLSLLTMDEEALMEKIRDFSYGSINQIIKELGLVQGLIQILFLHHSKELSEKFGCLPGNEIRGAFLESKKIPHCVCQLGDRPFNITFRRAIGLLSFFEKVRLVFSMLFMSNFSITSEELEAYKDADLLESVLLELGNSFPTMKQVLVDERDMYLAYSLQCATKQNPHLDLSAQAKKFNDSVASFMNCERRLINCRNELENFKKVVKDTNVAAQKEQLCTYEDKLFKLEKQYSSMQQQVRNEKHHLNILESRQDRDPFTPSVVVGVVGIGHVNGIVRWFNKVKDSEIPRLMEIPEPSTTSKLVTKAVKISVIGFTAYCCYRYLIPEIAKVKLESGSKNLFELVQTRLSSISTRPKDI